MDEPHAEPPVVDARRAMREARREATVVLTFDVALFVGLAIVDKAKGWATIDLPWWVWLVLAAPALILIVVLLAVPLAELSPGRMRNAGIALFGLLVASDAVAVAVLLAALIGSGAAELTAGDLLAHASVVWLSNIVTFGLERLPLRLVHQRHGLQPDRHDAADPTRQGPDGRGVDHLLRRRGPRRRARRQRPGDLTPAGASPSSTRLRWTSVNSNAIAGSTRTTATPKTINNAVSVALGAAAWSILSSVGSR